MQSSRRIVYRQSKRLLLRLMAARWSGSRRALEPAVRGFLRLRSRSYLLHLAGNRAFALAAVATLLATGAARAIPPIELSDVAAGSGGFVMNGIDPGDISGFSVSGAGDVNGDGIPDIIVGARGADPGGNQAAGKSYVVFGKADGSPVDLAEIEAGNGGFVINGIDSGDIAGSSVSGAGDVNGDGLDDVIIGAHYADPGGTNNAGESYVVFGKADTASVNLSDIVAGIGGFVINGYEFLALSGIRVSGAGDINGDGLDDVILGAPKNIFNYEGPGKSYVVFGKADTSAVNLFDVAAGNGGFVINGVGFYTWAGWSVSGAGDINGDGLDDVIVGEPASYDYYYGAGRSYVVFGKVDTKAVNLSDVAAGSGGFVMMGIDKGDGSGLSVSGAGDVNGDGLADVIVGAPFAAGNTEYAGESYVVFGKADTELVNLSDVAAGDGGFVMNGIDAFDNSGFSVSRAGDVNGDGLDDVIVGARRADPSGNTSAGESYVVFGKADTAPVNLSDVVAGDGGFAIYGIDPDDRSGGSVSGAGDFNGDGLDDVIVGARRADPGGNQSAGESYVVFSPIVWGDLDNDGSVGTVDLLILLANWGKCAKPCVPYCPGDLDRNCTVGTADLLILLANWGGL